VLTLRNSELCNVMQTAILEANSDKLVILDFFAPWCASCKGLYPKLSKMCEENPQIVVAKVNFEENKDLAKKLGVKVRFSACV
jgi:thiol-disulfide isomerase/thioredoxin